MVKVVIHSRESKPSIVEVLNDASLQLLEIGEEHEIYKILASAIAKIIPGAYCLVSKLQPDKKNFRIVQMYGIDKFIQSAKLILGKDLYELDFPFDELVHKHQQAFKNRKLFRLEEGLYGMSVGTINKTTCIAIEKIDGISDIFTTFFYLDDAYFGGVSILVPKRVMKSGIMNQEAILAIETLTNLATVLIQKLQANEELIHSRKTLETSYSRFNLLINNLTDIAWRANGDGSKIEDLNNSFKRIYGHSSTEFQKNPNLWIERAHPEDRLIVAKLSDELYRNGNVEAEYRVVRPDGKITWLHDRVSVICDDEGTPILTGGIAKDISEQKVLELKLQGIISEKDKILSIIAHDLKTPFNSMIGFTEILSEENNTISDEKRLMYIHLLHDSAVSTYKLLENLLEWSRLHLSNYEIYKKSICLKFVVDDCISLYMVTAENKKITVINQVSDEVNAYVDENSIYTVLRNLLNNALKYTPEYGSVTFSSTQKQNVVEISIQDTGQGIKPEKLNHLFRFGENTSTPGTKMEKGTGIGLVLCKELLDKNGGYIQVKSEFGKGSTFTLGLPNKSMEVNLPD